MHNEHIGDDAARREEVHHEHLHREAEIRTRDDRPLSSLFSELARETSMLVRKEVELARVEMAEKAGQVGSGVSSMAVGGAILYAGVLTLVATAVIALALVVHLWLSALIVGVVVTLAGLIVLQAGRRNLSARNLIPRRTVQSLRNDRDWAKEQIR